MSVLTVIQLVAHVEVFEVVASVTWGRAPGMVLLGWPWLRCAPGQ